MLTLDRKNRTLSLSVRKLASEGAASAHLHSHARSPVGAGKGLDRSRFYNWQRARAEQDANFRADVDIRTQLEVRGWTVKIQGRIAGLTEREGRCCVHGFQATTQSSDTLIGAEEDHWPAHALQIRLQMWMMVRSGVQDPTGELLVQPVSGEHPVVVSVHMSTTELEALVRAWVRRLIVQMERDAYWRDTRDTTRLGWPFQGYRAGQKELMRAIDLSLTENVPILVSAATGFGKSIATLTKTLAYAVRTGRSLFWATGRNSGAEAALDAARLLRENGMPLRVLSLRAKEKMCLNDAVTCHPDQCSYARDYYVKRNETDAVAQLHQRGVASSDDAMEIGEAAQICPHELLLDASRAVDMVIGDMNYVFDPKAMIKRHFPEESKRWVLVVDEAHGLVGRVRRALSPEISTKEIDEALACSEASAAWHGLVLRLSELVRKPFLESSRYRDGRALVEMPVLDLRDILACCEAHAIAYPPPEPVRVVVGRLRYFVEHLDWRSRESADAFTDISRDLGRLTSLGSLCIDPSGWISTQIRAFGGCVVLSATLRPQNFFIDNFGIGSLRPRFFDAGSPFPVENQLVLRIGHISTRYKDRLKSTSSIANVIASVVEAVGSGVALYFSSYAAMEVMLPQLHKLNRPLFIQKSAMTADERTVLLDRLISHKGVCVLCAVLGGSFAEAIDLPAGVLDAVIVVGPGLPPVGLEQSLLQRHYEARFSEGFLYASVVPGISKVVQAVGRLIRRQEDRGAVVLIGERFQDDMFSAQFPSWWMPVDVADPTVYLSDYFSREAQ